MASSGYTAVVFTANEQPTTAKWNLLGSNDSAFNLGTGLEDSTILTRHYASASVTSVKMALSKTTDANGWTIYDYGTFKKYLKASSEPSVTVGASGRTEFSASNLPVGMANLNNVHVNATLTGTSSPGNFFIGLYVSSGATSLGGQIANNYSGGSLTTDVFIIEYELTDK